MEINLSEDKIKKDEQLWNQLAESGVFGGKRICYGTSGFRFHNSCLDYIVYRVGFFVALISKKHSPKSWGVMITASHNPKEDNGVKIINERAGMMEVEFEALLEGFVNNRDLSAAMKELINSIFGDNEAQFSMTSFVQVGTDTRESAERLKHLLMESAALMNCKVIDNGYLATPHLYYIVNAFNKHKSIAESTSHDIKLEYFVDYGARYLEIMEAMGVSNNPARVIDCANGAGYLSVRAFLDNSLKATHDVRLINTTDKAKLNESCGAEHVHKFKLLPDNFPSDALYGITLDGDADRMIYFINHPNELELIDGDKTSALLAKLVLKICKEVFGLFDINFGVVMTNYSNFGLKEYLNKIGVEYRLSETGVKYAHDKAAQYDIGIFFESNGHGALLIKPSFLEKLKPRVDFNNKEHLIAWKILSFTNNLTGDGVFNILQTEIALRYLKMSVEDFASIFVYKKFKTYKLKVKNKLAVVTDEVKGIALAPKDLQPFIDELYLKHPSYNSRIFIRPSGTEDILRIHIEADKEDQIANLQAEVDKYIYGHGEIN